MLSVVAPCWPNDKFKALLESISRNFLGVNLLTLFEIYITEAYKKRK
jgi:hypothetical protein